MTDTNTTRIEEIAISILKQVLLKSPLLMPYITSNDKTPSWDGDVVVYNDEHAVKENIYGTVRVQVKGTSQRIRQESATHRFEKADLKNYYNDGGCILFLVSVNLNRTDDYKIYYSSLLVFDLDRVLKDNKEKDYITIPMREFPQNDTDEMASIFMSFLSDRKRQMQFIDKDIKSFSQLKKEGIQIEKVNFTVAGPNISRNSVEKYVVNHDIYVYAQPKGLDIDVTVEKIQNISLAESVSGPVKIKDKIYFSSYKVLYYKSNKTIRIGTGISFTADEENKKLNMRFKPPRKLSEFIADTTFFLDMIDQEEITLNHGTIKLSGFDKDKMAYDVRKAALQYYIKVQDMLKQLGTTEDLDIQDLTEKDHKNIKALVDAILYGKEIKWQGATYEGFYGGFKIGNLIIWIFGKRQPDGNYLISNFFQKHEVNMYDSEDKDLKKPIRLSTSALLDKDAFKNCSNMDYDFIEKDITESQLTLTQPAMDRYNYLLLEMIAAYDEQEIKSERLLNTAEKICLWMQKNPDLISTDIVSINLAQIHFRKKTLSSDEKIELAKMTDESYDNSIRCGAYILLEKYDSAKQCYSEMPANAQKEFSKYPICNLWTEHSN